MITEKTARKQRGRPFQKGCSGNPAGRPAGARNKATLAAEALLDGEAEILTRKLIELAKNGDLTALRLCLERILPARRDRPVAFDLPPINTTADAVNASAALIKAAAAGQLTPADAAGLGKLLDSHVRAIEATEFEQRLARIERRREDDEVTSS
jgi:Family of unknown function (DUF5681)